MSVAELIQLLLQENQDKPVDVEFFIGSSDRNSMQIWISNLENAPKGVPTIDHTQKHPPGS